MKTIREINENIGISKVSIYKLIKKPEIKKHIKKDGNVTFIDDAGEQIIIEYYSRQRLATLNDILDVGIEKTSKIAKNKSVNHINKPGLQSVNEVYNPDFIRILENQLNLKDEQLKEKDNQIKTKDEQIRQKDSQLNALLILLNKEKDINLISDNQYVSSSKTSLKSEKGFLKRLFGKKSSSNF